MEAIEIMGSPCEFPMGWIKIVLILLSYTLSKLGLANAEKTSNPVKNMNKQDLLMDKGF